MPRLHEEIPDILADVGSWRDRGTLLNFASSWWLNARYQGQIHSVRPVGLFRDWRSHVHLGKGARIELDGRLLLGCGASRIGSIWFSKYDKTILQMGRDSTLRVRGRVELRPGLRMVIGPTACVSLGDRTYINGQSIVLASKRIRIGAGCNISWRVQILDTDFHSIVLNPDAPEGDSLPVSLPIAIGDHVWIGAGVTICKGVTIGDHSVVAAGSVVVRDVEPCTLVGGVPARPLKTGISWR